jgi:type II secretory ATPase GspE/PulE/Tfp pilus assembly ATPase PilB-like protein
VVDDPIHREIALGGSVDAVSRLAASAGTVSLRDEIMTSVNDGLTSLAELSRIASADA